MLNRFSHVWLLVTLWSVACQAPLSMGFSKQETGVGCHALLQGIFLTHGWSPHLLSLLQWQMGSLPLVPPGKSRTVDPHSLITPYWIICICLSQNCSYPLKKCIRFLKVSVQFSLVQSLSHVQLFATPWTTAHQASLSIINSQSLPKLMSIESVMPSNHLILCHLLLLLPSIFPSIRVFSSESALHIRWPKYWSFSFNISPSNEHPGLISFRMDWLDLLAVQGTLKSLLQHHSSKASFFGAHISLKSHIHTWLLEKP